MSKNKIIQGVLQPEPLSAKVTKNGAGSVDLAAIERANVVMSELADTYLDWVEKDLANITAAYKDLMAHPDDPKDRLHVIFRISHEIKGQGGCFNYNLMTILGNDLCRFIEHIETYKPADLKLIELYINSMKIIISNRMSGDGGVEGGKMIDGLAAVVQKMTT